MTVAEWLRYDFLRTRNLTPRYRRTERVSHTQVLVWPSLRAQEQNDDTEPLGPCDRHPKVFSGMERFTGIVAKRIR
ncbi:hypothetical protein AMELA_G00150260 [Ameiurus melas]|uniref:Uncharacterized protein n=1 Tax=Ameiurus melas TaxID=219545 RepID=A0A7J6AHB2_AMEME|nr:hypothetical protein AMELA_G00150260 [Ameiurus melas]